MSIKKLRIAFDIDVRVLATALAEHNTGMHIELAGPAVEPEPPVPEMRRLPPPRGTTQTTVLERLKGSGPVKFADIRHWASTRGMSGKTTHNALTRLRGQGLVRSAGRGIWVITAKGAANGQ